MTTATENNRISNLAQLTDEVKSPSHKIFSLQENTLDGTYWPVGSLDQIGWWGTTLSDSLGVISTTPVVSVTFTRRGIYGLVVSGDNLLNEYPVDFDISLYDGITQVYSQQVIGNTQVSWQYPLSQVYYADKIEVTVYKVNKANRTVKLTEAYNDYVLKRSDAIALNVDGSRKKYINSSDLVAITRLVEDAITVSFTKPDTLDISLGETVRLINVHTIMNRPEREIFGKVEITYTDPYMDEDVTIVANTNNRVGSVEHLTDNVTTSLHKWFSLHDNKLDGSFYPVSSTYPSGWWSNALSDANGQFATAPVITTTFTKRAINKLRLVGEDKLNVIPVDFTINCYDETDTVIHSEVVTNNNLVSWQKDFIVSIQNVVKLELTVTKINKANYTARFLEFFTAIKEDYTNEELVSISLLEELQYPSGSLSLGNISANEVDIVLDNSTKKFTIGNTQSPLHGLLKKNRRVKVWLGIEVLDNQIEWELLGTFWASQWNVPEESMTATVTARDRLELLRLSDFNTSQVYQNYTLYQLFELVLNDAGLVASEYIIDTALNSVTIPWAWFNRGTHRDALQKLAGCAFVQVYCDRNNRVIVEQTVPTDYTVQHFSDDNVFSKEYPLATSEIANYVEVKTAPLVLDVQKSIVNLQETITVNANSTLEIEVLFNSIPSINVQAPVLTGDASVIVQSYTVYAWGMNIILENTAGVSAQVTNIDIQGQPLTPGTGSVFVAKDQTAIQQDGKIPISINHEFIQNTVYAQQLSALLLNKFSSSKHDLILDARGDFSLKLGDKATFTNTLLDTVSNYMIKRQDIVWDGSLRATIEGQIIDGGGD